MFQLPDQALYRRNNPFRYKLKFFWRNWFLRATMQRSEILGSLPRMIPTTDSVTSRIQVAVVAALVTMPAIISAAEQEPPPRHSLIQRSTAESSALPATTHGTILQPSTTESTHSASPIESHKPSVSPSPMPSPQHRTLTKRPPIASITAPPTSPQAAAGVSGITAGPSAQAAADTTNNSISAVAAPIAKPMTAPLAGVTSSASTVAAPTSASPLAGAAGAHSTASAGSGSAPSTGGSRSAANLIQNSAIMSLLTPSTPVVTTPPPPPPSAPPAIPPATPPPASPSTANVTLTWAANSEPDLAGYKIYVGTNSGVYSFSGSPFVTGKVTSYTISNLPKSQTYFFAISAYDGAGNESGLSAEASKSLY